MSLAIVETPNAQDRAKSEALLRRVDELLDEARTTYEALHRNYVEIGVAILAVQTHKAWMFTPHKSYDQYVKGCEAKFGRGRTALYGYTSVARELLPYIDEKTLVEIGISKSQSLAAFVKRTGRKPNACLIEAASNPEVGVEEFKASVAETLHEKPEAAGKWRDLGGAYFTEEEWAEVTRAFDYARIVDVIPMDVPDWLSRKRTIQRMAQECISSWEHEVLENRK